MECRNFYGKKSSTPVLLRPLPPPDISEESDLSESDGEENETIESETEEEIVLESDTELESSVDEIEDTAISVAGMNSVLLGFMKLSGFILSWRW